MINKKVTIYYEEGYDETDILDDAIEQIKEYWRDELTKKSAKETFDCDGDELMKFEITITVDGRTGY